MVTHEAATDAVIARLEGIPLPWKEAKHVMGCRTCQEVGIPHAVRVWQAINLAMAPAVTQDRLDKIEQKIIEKMRLLDARRKRADTHRG